MKLSTLTVTALLTLASASTFANEVVFKATNNDIATKACVLAATDGLSAAKDFVKQNDISFGSFKHSTSCNDMSLAKFASTYAQEDVIAESEQTETTTIIKLVARSADAESQLCVDAVVMGEDAAREKHGIESSVLCNDVSLSRFVRTYEDKAVALVVAED